MARFTLTSPSPAVTIFAVRVSLLETETVTSPRDGRQKVNRYVLPMCKLGEIPSLDGSVPVKGSPALWTGVQAGGSDSGTWTGARHGHFPMSNQSRWTNIPESAPLSRTVTRLTFLTENRALSSASTSCDTTCCSRCSAKTSRVDLGWEEGRVVSGSCDAGSRSSCPLCVSSRTRTECWSAKTTQCPLIADVLELPTCKSRRSSPPHVLILGRSRIER